MKPGDPTSDELSAAFKTATLLADAAAAISAAADKAKANGLSTRAEAVADKHSINLTSIVTAGVAIAGAAASVAGGVWFLMTIMMSPMQKQNDRIEVIQAKQGEALVGIQLDLRALYVASDTKKAERLEAPPMIPK